MSDGWQDGGLARPERATRGRDHHGDHTNDPSGSAGEARSLLPLMLAGGNQGMVQLEADASKAPKTPGPPRDSRFVEAVEATLTFDIAPGELARQLRALALDLATRGARDQTRLAAFLEERGLEHPRYLQVARLGLRQVLASGAIERAADRWAASELGGAKRSVSLTDLIAGNIGGTSAVTTITAAFQVTGELIDATTAHYAAQVWGARSSTIRVPVGDTLSPLGGAFAIGGLTSLAGFVVHRATSGEPRRLVDDFTGATYEMMKGATASAVASALVAGIASRVVASVVGFGISVAVATLIDVLIPQLAPMMLEAVELVLPLLMSPGLHLNAARERDRRGDEREMFAAGMGITVDDLAMAPALARDYIAYSATSGQGR